VQHFTRAVVVFFGFVLVSSGASAQDYLPPKGWPP
jgi:hypothetical protein